MTTETLAVETVDDLIVLQERYAALVAAGVPARIEARLGPGPFVGRAVVLDDIAGDGLVSVTLAGRPGAPAVLRDSPLVVGAAHFVLRDVVFADSERPSLLDVQVRDGLVLERVAFVGNRLTGRDGQAMVRLVAAYRASGQQAALRDVWFVDNHSTRRAALLSVGGDRRGGHFARLSVERTAWVDNRTVEGALIGSVGSLEVDDLLVLAEAPWPVLVVGRDVAGHLRRVRGAVASVSSLVRIHPSWEGAPVLDFAPEGLDADDAVLPAWLALASGATLGGGEAWDREALRHKARGAAVVGR